jgi:nucleoside-diphosphate-sugar epimerase
LEGWRVKKILVLGSSGQVGAYLCEFLRQLDYEVSEFDIASDSQQDLRIHRNELLAEKFKECDFVFFLAFDVGGSHYLEKYQDTFAFISNNMKIMTNTFQLLSESKKPFVFASSQMSNMSQSTYGLLKFVGEKSTHALGGAVVKFWNVYGVEHDTEKFHVISDFIDMARKGGPIRMRTTGKETRDFLYADDCSDGLVAIMRNYEFLASDREVHLANHAWTSILEIAEIVGEYFGVEVVPGDKVDSVQGGIKNSPREDFNQYWKPSISVQEGIFKIIQDLESS